MLKRCFSCIVLMALLLGAMCLPTAAMIRPGLGGCGDGTPAEPVLVTGVRSDFGLSTVFPLLTLAPGAALDTLELPATLSCTTNATDRFGRPDYYWCPVEWNLSDAPDTSVPGRILVSGTLKPGLGYFLADGVSAQIDWPVVITGERAEGPEVLAGLSISLYGHSLLPIGADAERALSPVSAHCFTTVPGEYFSCPVVWDFSGVKADVPGIYTATGMPVLPAGFSLPPDFQPFTRSVCVMPDDRVDLSAALFDPDTNKLSCYWILELPADAAVRPEYRIGQEPWQEDDRGYLTYRAFLGTSLSVNLTALELQTDYYFRLCYGEGDAELHSNALHVRLENWDFLGSPQGAPPFDIGGDRDGGDWDGGKLPDLEQPAPLPGDLSPAEEEAPVTELVTETATILSGRRVRQLAAASDTVLFSKQGVAAELPSAFLLALSLKDHELLEFTLEHPTDAAFRLALRVNGEELLQLPEIFVRLPWNETEGVPECMTSDGATLCSAVYEPESGTVRCTISAAGTYRLGTAAPAIRLSSLPGEHAAFTAALQLRNAAAAVSAAPLAQKSIAVSQSPAAPQAADPPSPTPPPAIEIFVPEAPAPQNRVPSASADISLAPAGKPPAPSAETPSPVLQAAAVLLLPLAAGCLLLLRKRHG